MFSKIKIVPILVVSQRQSLSLTAVLDNFHHRHPFVKEIEQAEYEGGKAFQEAKPEDVHLKKTCPWPQWPQSRRPPPQLLFPLGAQRLASPNLKKCHDLLCVPA